MSNTANHCHHEQMCSRYASKAICDQQGTDMLAVGGTACGGIFMLCEVVFDFLCFAHTDTRHAWCHAPNDETLRLLQVCWGYSGKPMQDNSP